MRVYFLEFWYRLPIHEKIDMNQTDEFILDALREQGLVTDELV